LIELNHLYERRDAVEYNRPFFWLGATATCGAAALNGGEPEDTDADDVDVDADVDAGTEVDDACEANADASELLSEPNNAAAADTGAAPVVVAAVVAAAAAVVAERRELNDDEAGEVEVEVKVEAEVEVEAGAERKVGVLLLSEKRRLKQRMSTLACSLMAIAGNQLLKCLR